MTGGFGNPRSRGIGIEGPGLSKEDAYQAANTFFAGG